MDPIDLVLPAHNEAATIGITLTEFHDVVSGENKIPIRFLVCEDGSTDATVKIVQDLSMQLPVLLLSEPIRKGYSRAVIDGLKACTSQLVAFVDSDGQCDPTDFVQLLRLQQSTNCDLVVGYRNPRRDHWIRLLMSGLFKAAYSLFFRSILRDPSCPYLIIKKDALKKILTRDVGILRQGFWWEFSARAEALGLRIEQSPVVHRRRTGGTTQVYRARNVPRIAWEHLFGLVRLRRELAISVVTVNSLEKP